MKTNHLFAERFIFIMNKDSSDYTEWRRSVFDDMSAEEISSGAERYMKDVREAQAGA